MLVTVLSFTATAQTLFSMYLIGRKKRVGWLVSFIGQGQWAAFGYITGGYGQIIGAGVVSVILLKNWLDWGNMEMR